VDVVGWFFLVFGGGGVCGCGGGGGVCGGEGGLGGGVGVVLCSGLWGEGRRGGRKGKKRNWKRNVKKAQPLTCGGERAGMNE